MGNFRSCISSGEKVPDAIRYLRSIGVNLSSQVDLVIATHWHSDHIAGLSKVLEECQNARFCWAEALTREESKAFLAAYSGSDYRRVSKGPDEFNKCLQVVAREKIKARRLKEDSIAMDWDSGALAHGLRVEFRALSPSDQQANEFLAQAMEFDQNTSESGGPLSTFDNENLLSVACLFSIGDYSVLLGADLETSENSDLGWDAVVALRKERRPSSLFKVPHHGSPNAHHDGQWNDLLTSDPISVVTPWSRGKSPLPKQADLDRINDRSARVFLTSTGTQTLKSKLDHATFRQIKNSGAEVKGVLGQFGQIRFRFYPVNPGELDIQNMGSAVELH